LAITQRDILHSPYYIGAVSATSINLADASSAKSPSRSHRTHRKYLQTGYRACHYREIRYP